MDSLGGHPLYSAFLFDTSYAPHGPFHSDDAFLDEVIGLLKGLIPFTHGDLAAVNIIVHNGNLSGIIDFENSGYYPVWWESAKCSLGFSKSDADWKRASQKEIPRYEEGLRWWQCWRILERKPESEEALKIPDSLPNAASTP
ncbi:Uu.00g056440.m01.CDS01 [Anthostomella pinea]|uniref:Uu.00g056440.m01.CDS01 n=1 Tax=Anthostomella pinea TaxID=933095 RepID=A0AAI8VS51_9PEZI|nr:Uu.00g056440.m01.CDS01 [Anthostomella pinea]